jgi:hypothetical protein
MSLDAARRLGLRSSPIREHQTLHTCRSLNVAVIRRTRVEVETSTSWFWEIVSAIRLNYSRIKRLVSDSRMNVDYQVNIV